MTTQTCLQVFANMWKHMQTHMPSHVIHSFCSSWQSNLSSTVALFFYPPTYFCSLPPPIPLCPLQSSYKVSVENPVCVKVMDAIQDLVEQRLDHSSRQLKGLLVGLGCSVELNNVLWKDKMMILMVVCSYTLTEVHCFMCILCHSVNTKLSLCHRQDE